MKRRLVEAALETAVALLAIVLALAAGGLLIAARGHDPIAVYRVLFSETLGLYVGPVVFKATTLAFTGAAAAFAFRSGMFNIGAEGQIYGGAFLCALAGLWLPSGTPAYVAIPILLVAAAAGGALVALPPAVLKATRGTHEVINTMMMNFIALAGINWWLGKVRVPETVHTPKILVGGRLPRLSVWFSEMRGSYANLSALVAVVACAAVAYVFLRTRTGYDLRAVGHSPGAAEYGGVSVRRSMVLALLGSGALAGLGGTNFVMGGEGYWFEQNFAPYQGYLGIAVALLARNNPMAVLPAAFLFAVLAEGGQAIQQFVPKEIGEILQALVIVFVVIGGRLLKDGTLRWQRRTLRG